MSQSPRHHLNALSACNPQQSAGNISAAQAINGNAQGQNAGNESIVDRFYADLAAYKAEVAARVAAHPAVIACRQLVASMREADQRALASFVSPPPPDFKPQPDPYDLLARIARRHALERALAELEEMIAALPVEGR